MERDLIKKSCWLDNESADWATLLLSTANKRLPFLQKQIHLNVQTKCQLRMCALPLPREVLCVVFSSCNENGLWFCKMSWIWGVCIINRSRWNLFSFPLLPFVHHNWDYFRISLALPHFYWHASLSKHHTKQMNDFSDSNGRSYRKHCAINKITAAVLQLQISCRWLVYTVLLAAVCSFFTSLLHHSTFYLFCQWQSSLSLQLLGFLKKLWTLPHYAAAKVSSFDTPATKQAGVKIAG